jgi:choline kinase
MKAIILAAGQGTRLLPFTREHPKCLVPVGGKAILDHQLEALAAAGVEDVLVVGGYLIERLEQHLSLLPARTRPGLLCNPFWSVANSIGSVWTARAHMDAPFILMNGDTILAAELIGNAIQPPGRASIWWSSSHRISRSTTCASQWRAIGWCVSARTLARMRPAIARWG